MITLDALVRRRIRSEGRAHAQIFRTDGFGQSHHLADRDIVRLMDRISVIISDDLPDNGEFPAELRITLSDGSTRVERRHKPRGGSTDPLSDEELEEKLRNCASIALDQSAIARIRELVSRLDRLDDVNELGAMLEGMPK